MRYFFDVLQVLLLLLALSCAPKPPPQPVAPPGPAIPKWVDGKVEDSLYLYGVSKIEIGKDGKGNIEDIAYKNITDKITAKLKDRLSIVSDSTRANFSGYMNKIIEHRISKSLAHTDIAEKYKGKNYEYALARLDKKNYVKTLFSDKQNATIEAIKILNDIDDKVSKDNFTKIYKAVDTISMFLDYYPVIEDTTKYKKPVGIIDVARDIMRAYNERISINFDPQFLGSMPLVNDNKRIRVSTADLVSKKLIKGIWITTRFSDVEQHDLIMTKNDGSTVYQTKPILKEAGSYNVSFEIGYRAMMDEASVMLLNVKPKTFPLTVFLSAPKIYFENIMKSFNDSAPTSQVVDAIRTCFINKYSAVFVNDKNESDIILSLDISMLEHKEKVSDIYPYFVHATGSITLTDMRTNEKVFNHAISEKEGSDFDSIEKAGLNSLKNLAEQLSLEICGL